MNPNISLSELSQLRRNHEQIWPDDLIEDIEDEYPQVCQERAAYDSLIAQKVSKRSGQSTILEEEQTEKTASIIKTLPTLVIPGWQNTEIKGKKNWADFENLLLFYTIGKLKIADSFEKQKEHDISELRKAIESFLPLRGQKFLSAEERVAINTTYLAFGKRVIDNLITNDFCSRHEIKREIQDAEETNYFNGLKLERSYSIASRVLSTLQKRYC